MPAPEIMTSPTAYAMGYSLSPATRAERVNNSQGGALANCRNTVEDLCLQSTKRKILTRHNKGAQDDNS
jgi:hypothetical protein